MVALVVVRLQLRLLQPLLLLVVVMVQVPSLLPSLLSFRLQLAVSVEPNRLHLPLPPPPRAKDRGMACIRFVVSAVAHCWWKAVPRCVGTAAPRRRILWTAW